MSSGTNKHQSSSYSGNLTVLTSLVITLLILLLTQGSIAQTNISQDSITIASIHIIIEHLDSNNHGKVIKMEKFDSLGRLSYLRFDEVDGDGYREEKYIYKDETNHIKTTVRLSSDHSIKDFPETTKILYQYDSLGRRITSTEQTFYDSILWIVHLKYNSHDDVILEEYQQVPGWILNVSSDYIKDSIHYNYEKNLKETFMVGTGGIIISSIGSIQPDTSGWTFDDHGNLIENEFTLNEYKYDHHHNWIYQKSYSKRNNTVKVKSIKTRKIKYRRRS